ncbi:hypothetical protein BMG_6459 (plasmid) [Priestia megaterium]|uniref:hypothetical protein n=1 Tax=Priestia megaterium TaxID=1404 RepID=UPI0015DCA2CA|nr:hypothetical protein [Priestia megaterium]QLK09681.1 hypothetical protein BMG_6459 [Priestia megaterium]
MENKLKHLEFIQQTITRMSSNSFLLKGWAVTIIVGIFAFANTKELNSQFLWIALIPAIFFWFLDSLFLREEKLYRKLYDEVRVKKENVIDFSMDTSNYIKVVPKLYKICFSKTVGIFYIPIITVIIVTIFLLNF